MNAASLYPEVIDEMIFFQDNDIAKEEAINAYNALISAGQYDEANAYIAQHEEIYGFFADYMNALENRIYNLQEYLLNKSRRNPFILSDTEPETANNGDIWI